MIKITLSSSLSMNYFKAIRKREVVHDCTLNRTAPKIETINVIISLLP